MSVSEEELLKQPPRELVSIIVGQAEVMAQQQEVIARLEERIRKLEEELRESQRAKAPFSKGKGKERPGRPGRKKGQGRFGRRGEPEVKEGDEVRREQARLREEQRRCARCGRELEVSWEGASVVDVPEAPRRVVTFFEVEVGRCPWCGHQERGRHPELKPDQKGATAHRVGAQVLSQALGLHYRHGLPLRKVPAVLEEWSGIKLSEGALSQAACTLCEEGGVLHGHYEGLREEVARSAVVNTDDTGWRIKALPAYLMGFFTQSIMFYQIRFRHRHEEVMEVIGAGFHGLLGTDRGKSYEARALEGVRMQKCLSHVLKNLSEVETTKTGRAKTFTTTLKTTLREGLALWHEYQNGRLESEEYRRRGALLEKTLTHLLRHRLLSDADNQRLLDGLGWQMDRGRLTLFLRHPEIEPTNNRAERGLRSAVIARKVSHCSKNERGAHTTSVMKTLFGTLAQRTKHVAQAFASLLSGSSFPEAAGR